MKNINDINEKLEKLANFSPGIFSEIWEKIGDQLEENALYEKALVAFEKADNKEKSHHIKTIILEARLKKLETEARIFMHDNLLDRAIEKYNEIISLDKDLERNWNQFTDVCQKKKELLELFEDIQKDIALEKWIEAKKKLLKIFEINMHYENNGVRAIDLFTRISEEFDETIEIPDSIFRNFIEISTDSINKLEKTHLIPLSDIRACDFEKKLIVADTETLLQYVILDSKLNKKEIDKHIDKKINTLALSSDNRMIAYGFTNGKIQLIYCENNQIFAELEHQKIIKKIVFSPDGRKLISIGSDRKIRVWRVKDGMEESCSDTNIGTIWDAAFSKDGNTLVSASSKGIHLWDVFQMKLLNSYDTDQFILNQHPSFSLPVFVWRICFSPCGNFLATSSSDNVVRLWAFKDNQIKLISEFKKHKDQISFIIFSPDGKMLVSVSRDKKVYFWDISTNEILHMLEGESFNKIFFNDDGTAMISISNFQNVQLWRIEREC